MLRMDLYGIYEYVEQYKKYITQKPYELFLDCSYGFFSDILQSTYRQL